MSVDIHNLTMPISPFMASGGLYPWESPHQREDIVTVERNRAHLFFVRLGSGGGTRIRTAGYGQSGAATVDQIAMAELVNRDAVVLRIPKGPEEVITAEDLTAAFAALAASLGQDWDATAVLIATGWGSEERQRTLGERFVLASPFLGDDAAELLLQQQRRRGISLVLTDCVDVDRSGGHFARQDWAELTPWLRPPWPSDQARTYLRHYRPEMARTDHHVALSLTRSLTLITGLVGCDLIPHERVRLTVLPFQVGDVAEAPCTVVAEDLT